MSHGWTEQLHFICCSWLLWLEGPCGGSRAGGVLESKQESGVTSLLPLLLTLLLSAKGHHQYERHILYSWMCRCVKFLLSTTGHIQEENCHPCELGSKAWCFLIAGYVFSSNASAELWLQQDRILPISSYCSLTKEYFSLNLDDLC